MNIILVGAGKAGVAVAQALDKNSECDITVIDKDDDALEALASVVDCQTVLGSGLDATVLAEAGVTESDIFIAMTDSDELNLLLCLIAKKNGKCKTIARVRDPIFRKGQREFIRSALGLNHLINPEFATAKEISLALLNPNALCASDITEGAAGDNFSRDKIELLTIRLSEDSTLCNKRLCDVFKKSDAQRILICAILRDNEVIIPDGKSEFKGGDLLSFVATNKGAGSFFKSARIKESKVKRVAISGGSRVSYYLAKRLLNFGIHVKIIEENTQVCEELRQLLPQSVDIVSGSATDLELLREEISSHTDAFICLTENDEENIITSLCVKNNFKIPTYTKIGKLDLGETLACIDTGKIIDTRQIISSSVSEIVRSFENAEGSGAASVYRILNEKASLLSFLVSDSSNVKNIPIGQMTIRPDVNICCIARNSTYFIPSGSDVIKEGDYVFVVTKDKNMDSLERILL